MTTWINCIQLYSIIFNYIQLYSIIFNYMFSDFLNHQDLPNIPHSQAHNTLGSRTRPAMERSLTFFSFSWDWNDWSMLMIEIEIRRLKLEHEYTEIDRLVLYLCLKWSSLSTIWKANFINYLIHTHFLSDKLLPNHAPHPSPLRKGKATNTVNCHGHTSNSAMQ